VLDAGSQLLSELSPDAMAPIFTAFTGQFSLQKEQRIRGRAIVLTTPGARGNYFHGVLSFCRKFICCSCGLFEPKKDTSSSTTTRLTIRYKRLRCWAACSERCSHLSWDKNYGG
jgi:hypothetical protein